MPQAVELDGMRIVFVSMNTMGKNCLDELLKLNADIAGVFTLDEKYSANVSDFEGFGEIARKNGIPLFKVKNINEPENLRRIRELKPDMIFVIGWSQILSKELLDIPPKGCVGTHPALLPKNRGRAAIPWQILNHEKESGLSFFCLGLGPDDGPIIAQKKFALAKDETATSFYEKVVGLGRQIMRESLPLLEKGTAPKIKQDESRATYLEKRTPADGLIDWTWPNERAWDLIRATAKPYPGAFSHYKGKKLIIWSASLKNNAACNGKPGEVLAIGKQGVEVCCGRGSVLLEEVELEGQGIKKAESILKKAGERLEKAESILSKAGERLVLQ